MTAAYAFCRKASTNKSHLVNVLDMKRAFDTVFSLLALSVGLPFFLLIALIVLFSSKGPIFYSSKRVGKGGSLIHCWKFRTMHLDADARLEEILKNPSRQEEWRHYRKLKEDPRITVVGNFLRKTSLDELPQFWNVLKGDLSVVGPRPITEDEVTEYLKEKAAKILSVRPGITGLWQTSGRNLISYKERVLLEERYIEERSFLFDLKLICKTCRILFSKGAY